MGCGGVDMTGSIRTYRLGKGAEFVPGMKDLRCGCGASLRSAEILCMDGEGKNGSGVEEGNVLR